ncbi:MAG: hypothetical protein RR561_05405 [Peptostreptococcus sp.]|uniref:SLAC1 family transporter n=1 Tax=Peptostreptococcus sp. TaxID=1262 RepID=UPI002FC609A1
MKDFASKLPLPVAALALGWVLLGNIFKNLIPFLSDICMIISLILLILTIVKLVLDTKSFYKSLRSPVGLSIFSSFSMSLMLISVWMKGVLDKANIYIWIVGVVLHTIIMIIFTLKYVLNFKMKYVFSSWFLVYSGIGVAAITCNDFGMIVFGRTVLKFCIGVSVVLVPLVLARMKSVGSTQAARPVFSLISLPLGLILPALMLISDPLSARTMWIMFVVIQLILLFVLIDMLIQIFHGFYPSWSCYTVSVSVSVYASMYFNNYLIDNKMRIAFIDYLMYFEYVLVFLVCALILLAYFINTLEDPELHKRKVQEKMVYEKSRREKRIEDKQRRESYRRKGPESDPRKKRTRDEKTGTFEDDDDIMDLID